MECLSGQDMSGDDVTLMHIAFCKHGYDCGRVMEGVGSWVLGGVRVECSVVGVGMGCRGSGC